MGGLHMCQHWIEELKKPLVISQEDVSKDLVRFVHGFPIDSIPYQSENEKKIEKYKKAITKIRIDKLHLK
jgi:hypothetical protein